MSNINAVKGWDVSGKLLYAFMTLLGIVMILPLVFLINRSLMPLYELFIYPPRLFVRQPTFKSFVDLLNIAGTSFVPASRYIFNSVVVSAAVVTGSIIIGGMCAYPLAKLTNPDLQKYSSVISQVGPKTSINIEEFINASPDTVIYYNIPEALQQFEAAGIPAVVVTWVSTPATSLEESIKEQRQKMGVVAELLGGEAPKRFEKWMKYYEEKVAFLRSRTANLPAEKRPRVYIGNSWGPNPLATWGKESGHDYTIELCGGRYVAKDIAAGQFPEVSMEQVIGWGPEVIFIDNHGREPEKVIENIKKDPSWAAVPAVKNGHIYRIPEGVFFLDKGTSAAVYLLWAAKKLHPDLFSDIDMAKELQYYFKEFYGYDLTKEQAEKILAGGPDDPGRWEGVKAQ